jgi:uncharacterized membrane protein YeaQ/YmgE (transglycosylase-associated protein family)
MKIRDSIMLGVTAGMLAGFPARFTNTTTYKLGLTDRKYGQMAASLFLPTKKQKVHPREAQIVGFLADYINCGIIGVLVANVLAKTGRDRAILKGVGVAALAWMALYGLTTRLKVAPPSRKPLSSILSFGDHMLFGALCGLIADKIGHDSLFPPQRSKTTGLKPLSQATTPSYSASQ